MNKIINLSIIAFLVVLSFSQDLSDLNKIAKEKGKMDIRSSNMLDLKKIAEDEKAKQTDRLQMMEDYVPLEGKVDEEKYIIGPHDVLSVTYIVPDSDESETIDLPVNPDGMVVIPSWGALDLSGMSLKDAKAKIEEKLNEMFVFDKLMVNLAKARIFRAHITGFVQLPGAYNVMASFRLAKLIEMAGGRKPNADLSRIKIYRDNDTLDVNLSRYYIEGNIESNPFLLDGDIVFIPSVKADSDNIIIAGAVQRNGKYPLEAGQKLSDIVPDIVDNKDNVDLSRVKVVRSGASHIIDFEGNEDFALQSNDRLIIPIQPDSVLVTGHVATGGNFKYMPHQDYKAYLAMAGGPTEKGSINRVALYRNGEKLNPRKVETIMPGDVLYVKAGYFTRVLDIVSILSQSATVAIAIYTINRNNR
ncbi:MAG: polysaccharide biosynthesis/export family protein [Candidatus Zixiibacteriota bacterium]